VFDVKKESSKHNAFAMGVTIGRVDSNDIPLDDVSVSRFHAWLQADGKGWVVCDAESKNGTFLDGKRLAPNQKVPVKDKAKLKFGEVEVTFLEVEGLIAMMELTMTSNTK
jgi:pSer/pThr/pTyr-binding forkhead associated (FHA) protein